jgi:uncharacterized membrane protein (UPF0127 family)
MTTWRLLLAGVCAVAIAVSVILAPFVDSGAEAQHPPGTATLTAQAVIPEISADRDVPEVQLAVTQGDAQANLDLRVAADEAERERGLMWITTMPEDEGMLFLFTHDGSGGFWMKNTYIPLDIAFIDARGTVVAIRQGEPLDTTILTPGSSYRYVIETNVGWWAAHGFSAGAQVHLPEDLPVAS